MTRTANWYDTHAIEHTGENLNIYANSLRLFSDLWLSLSLSLSGTPKIVA